MKKGLFISIEGSDGAGKSTQIEALKAYFQGEGREVLITREPGGTKIGEKIRDIILDKEHAEMDFITEAFLYAASRAQHVAEIISPAINNGKIVICDRFIDSSIAYQGYGRKLGKCVADINEYAVNGCMPDITLFMDIPAETAYDRIKEGKRDRIESEKIEFYKTVREGYLKQQEEFPDRIIKIDASRTIEEITEEVLKHVNIHLQNVR